MGYRRCRAVYFKVVWNIGLTQAHPQKEADSGGEAEKDVWAGLFASLMYQGTMTHEEILKHSIPFLLAIGPQINSIRLNTASMGMIGGFGVVPSASGVNAPPKQAKSREEFLAYVNGR